MSENRAGRRYNLIHAYRQPGSPRQHHLDKNQVRGLMSAPKKQKMVPRPAAKQLKPDLPKKANLINKIFGRNKTP